MNVLFACVVILSILKAIALSQNLAAATFIYFAQHIMLGLSARVMLMPCQ